MARFSSSSGSRCGGGVKAICLAHLPAGPKFAPGSRTADIPLLSFLHKPLFYRMNGIPSRNLIFVCKADSRPTDPLPIPREATVTDSSRNGHLRYRSVE